MLCSLEKPHPPGRFLSYRVLLLLLHPKISSGRLTDHAKGQLGRDVKKRYLTSWLVEPDLLVLIFLTHNDECVSEPPCTILHTSRLCSVTAMQLSHLLYRGVEAKKS